MSETDFQPVVQQRVRLDGWTSEKQIAFIEALAETASVTDACARVGMSRDSAYRLRHRDVDGGFDHAWRYALVTAANVLTDTAFERALNGVAQPVFHRGEQVGERRKYDNRLLYSVLRAYDAPRYDPERVVRYRERSLLRTLQQPETVSEQDDREDREFAVDDLIPDPVKPVDRLTLLALALDDLEDAESEPSSVEDSET